MKEILIIPKEGESYTLPSVGDVLKELGVSYKAFHAAMENGTYLHTAAGEDVFVDVELDVDEIPQVERQVKYELVAHDNTVYPFTSYAEIARFLNRSYRTVRDIILQNGKSLSNGQGEKFALRVLKHEST